MKYKSAIGLKVSSMKAYASAPAKVIITGEHFVVLGEPAVAAAIKMRSIVSVQRRKEDDLIGLYSTLSGISGIYENGRFEAKTKDTSNMKTLAPIGMLAKSILNHAGAKKVGLDININSDIPIGVGLGSSAATAVSVVAAIVELLSLKISKSEICKHALVQEKYIHRKLSGIDHTTSTYGGLIFYEPKSNFLRIKGNKRLRFVVGNGENPMDTPKEFVLNVTKTEGKLSLRAADALKRGDMISLGKIMNKNHELLSELGFSCAELDNLVEVSREAGALGAKLNRGDDGGCMIALTKEGEERTVANAIEKAGGSVQIVEVDNEGVKSWGE